MKLTELRVDRLKREFRKLELPTTGTKNELQRRLREQLQLHGIDIETYEFEDEEEQDIQAPVVPSSVDINSLLAAMMEKMEVTNQKLLDDVHEASRTGSQKMQETNRAETHKLLEPKTKNFWLMFKKLLEPKTKNFWLNREKIMNK